MYIIYEIIKIKQEYKYAQMIKWLWCHTSRNDNCIYYYTKRACIDWDVPDNKMVSIIIIKNNGDCYELLIDIVKS